jgi:heptosyltransferase-2
VAIAPGAAYGGAKRWPPIRFAELLSDLRGDGVQCVLVGAAADAPTASEVLRDARPGADALAPIDLVGRTDLAVLAGVLALCRTLVTNDSGAMHLAAAIGVDVTALFGPTDDRATSPRPLDGRRALVLTHPVWCRPCMLRECPLDHRCMRSIDPRVVVTAARARLGAQPS